MRIADITPAFQTHLEHIKSCSQVESLWQQEARDVAALIDGDYTGIDEMLDVMHRAQRVLAVHDAGLENDQNFLAATESTPVPRWKDFSAPPVDDALQLKMADALYNITDPANDYAVLNLGDTSRKIGVSLVRKLIEDGVPFDIDYTDGNFQTLVINHADKEKIPALASSSVEKYAPASKRIVCRPGKPEGMVVTPDGEKSSLHSEGLKPFIQRILSGDLFFTLTTIPTRKDAELDRMDYNEYLKLFFEMCDQPWDEISKAQQFLIEELDAAKTVRFTNDAGTDITMDIEGFTFCNSLQKKNVPGSEAYSAPRRDSVNGTVVAPGLFYPPGIGLKAVENLRLTFKDGKIVDFSADKGAEHFQEWLDRDPGNYYVGELGIGTNPHLKRHVVNTLLVEKIGGSFHLALGGAYTFKEYDGKPVKVDNGNRSKDHWDVTTMLHGQGGTIELDGRQIMRDGKFLDPRLCVLNEGWAAIPREQRPDYWKDYDFSKVAAAAPAPVMGPT